MTLTLSNSKANTFKRCEKKYEFKYVLGLRPKDKALPLFRGDWLHQLLMVYCDGMDWKQRHAMLRAVNWDNLFDEEREDLGGNLPEEVVRIFKGYLAHYREQDRNWRTVDTEINETVELPNGMQLNVVIDRIAEDLTDHSLWIWDYKTVSRLMPDDFMLIDSQLALYFWVADEVLGYRPLRGAMFDELLTKPPTLPKMKSRGLEQRKNLQCTAYAYFEAIKKHGEDPKKYTEFLRYLQSKHDQWYRRTRLPRDSDMVQRILDEMQATGEDILNVTERGIFTRSSCKDCLWDCDYLEPCIADLQGADLDGIIKIKYDKSKRPDDDDLKRFWPSEYKIRRANAAG